MGKKKGKGRGKPVDDKTSQGNVQKAEGRGQQSGQASGEASGGKGRGKPEDDKTSQSNVQKAQGGGQQSGQASGGNGRGKPEDDKTSQGSVQKAQGRGQQSGQASGEASRGRGRGRATAGLSHVRDPQVGREPSQTVGKDPAPPDVSFFGPSHIAEPQRQASVSGPAPPDPGREEAERSQEVGRRPSVQSAGKVTPTPAKKEDEYPQVSAPASQKELPRKDDSCRKKVPSVPEQQILLEQMAGLSLEQKTPVKKRLMAKRPNYGSVGVRISLYVNYFKLNYKSNTLIYHYDVDISESNKDNSMGKSLMSEGRTAKEDIKMNVKHVERQKRRNLGKAKCRQIISKMISQNVFQRYSPVYDGQKNIFTSKPFPLKGKTSYPVDICMEGRDKRFYVTIQPVEKQNGSNIIDMEPLIQLYRGGSSEIPQEVLLVYETIMNHREPPFQQIQFRNSFFSLQREAIQSLGNGLEIWIGYNQSVRLTEQGPVVVINLAAKAFHKAGPVIKYASDVLGTDITRIPRFENWQIQTLVDSLKGVNIKVTHQRNPRKYKVKGLTPQSADDLQLDVEGRRQSVTQYFLSKYNVRLNYPHLPCLHMQTNNNTTYIPMETCEVVEGQPKIGKLSADLTSKMIRSTAIPPKDRFQRISSDARKVQGISKRFMDAFGLIMDINLMKVDGRIIAAPKIAYKGDPSDTSRIASPDKRGVWRVEDGKKFYEAVNVKNWVLISFADERRFGYDALSKYCHFLVQSGNKCGMRMERPQSIKICGRNITTEKAISEAKKSGAQFAIVVLNRRDNYHTYDEVKFLADFKYGLVTQCMEDKTIGRINDQITTNVCLKINVKIGGINHILLHRPQIFSQSVVVFGADAIHWTRGYGYPSIVSVVASLNPTASKYALTCHLQRNEAKDKISQEIIRHDKMNEISQELLQIFTSTARIPPKKIIVFRDGVSDGQFQHALDQEVSGIQKASKILFDVILPITFIVVQKRHQTRFRPEDERQSAGKCQNIPPGTVVDKNITHPVFFDFFVCSHEGIQGTSKPAHYTVLHDDNNFKADELQQLCHFLCHMYIRCTRSVSLPAPVLYADLAAARAKKYADLHIRADNVTVSSEDTQRDLPRHVVEAIQAMRSFENNMFYV